MSVISERRADLARWERDATEEARAKREAFINSGQLSMGGCGPFFIKLGQQVRQFEFNGVCGPVLVNDRGNPLSKQPGDSSPFWSAFDAWRKAGCYTNKLGYAILPSQRILEGNPPS